MDYTQIFPTINACLVKIPVKLVSVLPLLNVNHAKQNFYIHYMWDHAWTLALENSIKTLTIITASHVALAVKTAMDLLVHLV